MKSGLRNVLAMVLLLLFVLENGALACLIHALDTNPSDAPAYVHYELHSLAPLLAEVNEERDNKEDDSADNCFVETTVSFSNLVHSLSSISVRSTGVLLTGRTLPLYTVFCSFII